MGKSKKSCQASVSSGQIQIEELSGPQLQRWSESQQRLFGDCFTVGTESRIVKGARLDFSLDGTSQLSEFWEQMKLAGTAELFTNRFGNIARLLSVQVDKELLRAAFEFWDPSYRCFSSKEWDLAPTLEEYSSLLNLPLLKSNSHLPPKFFIKASPPEPKRYLAKLLGSDHDTIAKSVVLKEKREYISKDPLLQFIQRNVKEESGRMVLALAIYGLVVFPSVPNYIDLDIVYFFDRVCFGGIMPVYPILAETYRSLNYCRQSLGGPFYACPQLLMLWLQGHLSEMSKSPEKMTKQEWMVFLHQLPARSVRWISSYLSTDCRPIIRCQKFGYVPLLGIWGEIGYSSLLVLRQFGIKQCVPFTYPLKDEGFKYEGTTTRADFERIKDAWSELSVVSMGSGILQITSSYHDWFNRRHRDVIPPTDWMIDPVKVPVPVPDEVLEARYLAEIEKGMKKQKELQSVVDQMVFEAGVQADVTKTTLKSRENAIRELERVKQRNQKLEDSISPRALYHLNLKRKSEARKAREQRKSLESEVEELETENRKLSSAAFQGHVLEVRNQTLEAKLEVANRQKRKLTSELEASKKVCQDLADRLTRKEGDCQESQDQTSWAIVPYQEPLRHQESQNQRNWSIVPYQGPI